MGGDASQMRSWEEGMLPRRLDMVVAGRNGVGAVASHHPSLTPSPEKSTAAGGSTSQLKVHNCFFLLHFSNCMYSN